MLERQCERVFPVTSQKSLTNEVVRSLQCTYSVVGNLLSEALTRGVALPIHSFSLATRRTGGTADSIAPADMITDPTQNNIFNRPVVQITALPAGVTILAQ